MIKLSLYIPRNRYGLYNSLVLIVYKMGQINLLGLALNEDLWILGEDATVSLVCRTSVSRSVLWYMITLIAI